jgi:hypothetical protein
MSKKDFIALAETIRNHNRYSSTPFSPEQLDVLASFCKSQNSAFMKDRWLGFIAGENGPSGGTVRK